MLAIGLGIWSYKAGSSTVTNNQDLILFYGDTCTHCLKVEEFLNSSGDLATRLNLTRKEVFNDAGNQKELVKKAKICGLDTTSVGVPFLWNKGVCLVGLDEVLNFFKNQNNVQ